MILKVFKTLRWQITTLVNSLEKLMVDMMEAVTK